jgi:hypothetical protein
MDRKAREIQLISRNRQQFTKYNIGYKVQTTFLKRFFLDSMSPEIYLSYYISSYSNRIDSEAAK